MNRVWVRGLVALAVLAVSTVVLCQSFRSSVTGSPVAAELERFYGQALSWEDCREQSPGAECARLTVPMEYARPGGQTITLGLLRIRAISPDRRIGSLVINSGGPGASGVAAAGELSWDMHDTELARMFDVVGFDPRGVGVSEPRVRCLTGDERDALRREKPPTDLSELEARSRAYVATCVDRSGRGHRYRVMSTSLPASRPVAGSGMVR